MSIELLRVSTEQRDGDDADGWVLVINLFGFVFELLVARRK